jgi:hypothetical protein
MIRFAPAQARTEAARINPRYALLIQRPGQCAGLATKCREAMRTVDADRYSRFHTPRLKAAGGAYSEKQLAQATGVELSLGRCVTNDRRRGVGKAAIDQNAREHELVAGVCALHDAYDVNREYTHTVEARRNPVATGNSNMA